VPDDFGIEFKVDALNELTSGASSHSGSPLLYDIVCSTTTALGPAPLADVATNPAIAAKHETSISRLPFS